MVFPFPHNPLYIVKGFARNVGNDWTIAWEKFTWITVTEAVKAKDKSRQVKLKFNTREGIILPAGNGITYMAGAAVKLDDSFGDGKTQAGSFSPKRVSILTAKARLWLGRSSASGTPPRSHLETAWQVTPTKLPSCSWVIPFVVRYFLICFPISHIASAPRFILVYGYRNKIPILCKYL